jgi:hypothetical protein
MPRREELSLDAMLADPIVRDLTAADGVTPAQVKALARSLGRPGDKPDHPARRFVNLFNVRCAPATPPKLAADRDQTNGRESRIALVDYSRVSATPLGSAFDGEPRCTARS